MDAIQDAQIVMRTLVANEANDELLAKVARVLFVPHEEAEPALPKRPPVKVKSEASGRSELSYVSATVASARRAASHIPGLLPELVRINVKVDGKRTSLSFPRPNWAVLVQKMGKRRCLEAAERFAGQFRGRGSRSAFVLDQLEAHYLQEAASTAAAGERVRREADVPLPLPSDDLFGSLRA